jgi:hypothetical protein
MASMGSGISMATTLQLYCRCVNGVRSSVSARGGHGSLNAVQVTASSPGWGCDLHVVSFP